MIVTVLKETEDIDQIQDTETSYLSTYIHTYMHELYNTYLSRYLLQLILEYKE